MSTTKRVRKAVKLSPQKTLELIPEKLEKEEIKEIKKTLETIPEMQLKTSLTIEIDDSELRVIETYTKLWNDRHADIEDYVPINPAQFLLYATLKWCAYEECGGVNAIEGDELGAEEDATPIDPLDKAAFVDPADDDPEFVEAFVNKLGGVR